MDRISVIQNLIDAQGAKIYLEIGVGNGQCFLQIKASRKIGVDMKFSLSYKRGIAKNYLVNLKSNIFNKYYQMSSDLFFRKYSGLFKKRKIDVVFIDGLHEYNQVIRDVNNCLNFLSVGGVIVLHDCNPDSEKVSLPFTKNSGKIHGPWMGDVWKAIVYFRSLRDDLSIFVLKTDCGLGILTKGKPDSKLAYSLEDIKNLSYRNLEKSRSAMLSLKDPDYLEEFIKKMQSAKIHES